MNRVSFVVTLLAGLSASGQAFAWGRDGHETVGYIAASLIKGSNAATQVASILNPDESLATAAEWPDCAKGFRYCQTDPTPEMKEFAQNNPAHHSYHYTDVPFQRKSYKPDGIGTSPDDVVHALEDAIRTLQGNPVADPKHVFTRRDALFILAHMVGDIHQPLHVGAAYVNGKRAFVDPKSEDQAKKQFTEGGNWLCVGSKGLHSLWDTDYVKRAMKNRKAASSEDFAKALMQNPSSVPQDSGAPLDWPAEWATETLKLASTELRPVIVSKKRIQGPKGSCGKPAADADPSKIAWTVTLPGDYATKAVGVVPKQLVKAGTRLANLLKAIWP